MYTLKKSLGQHFLTDEKVCRQIVTFLLEHKFNQLVEVGPGGGALTKFLLPISDINFKAVELDGEKVNFLEKAYPAMAAGTIVHQDFLKMPIPFETGEFIVIGNFPYNISSQIVFKILEWKIHVPVMIGMFQKEVALRIVSKKGSKAYGIISVLVQAFYSVEYLFDVPPESFNPPPKVVSAVIRCIRKNKLPEVSSEKDFFLLVKTAFNQRRKMLRNAVKALFSEQDLANEIFTRRAEQLSVDDFAALTFSMKKN